MVKRHNRRWNWVYLLRVIIGVCLIVAIMFGLCQLRGAIQRDRMALFETRFEDTLEEVLPREWLTVDGASVRMDSKESADASSSISAQTTHYLELYGDWLSPLFTGIYYVPELKGAYAISVSGLNETHSSSSAPRWRMCPLAKCPEVLNAVMLFGDLKNMNNYRVFFEKLPGFSSTGGLGSTVNEHDCPPCSSYDLKGNTSTQTATKKMNSDTLLIMTVCNHIDATVAALDFLESSSKMYVGKSNFDLIVIDDSSSDGTAEYLKKRGYAVITNRRPRGVTYSWNLGYKIAKRLGYTGLILANNDVLFSQSAVEVLISALRESPLAVPVTSLIGAGHNPSQALSLAHKLTDLPIEKLLQALRSPKTDKEKRWVSLEAYLTSPGNTNFIQDYLYKKFKTVEICRLSGGIQSPCPALTAPALFRNSSRFNGFFFALNITTISPVSHSEWELFNPADVMVEQENWMVSRMNKLRLSPSIALHSFIYHFKSVTVAVANFTRDKAETRNNLSLYHSSRVNRPVVAIPHSTFELFRHMPKKMIEKYPSNYRRPIIAFAVSDMIRNPLAGDIFTAKEMALHLRLYFNVYIKLLHKNNNYYDASNVDVLVAMLDDLNPALLTNAKPGLIKVAWMRNWFHRWFSRPWFGNFDLVLSSSEQAKDLAADLASRTGRAFPAQCNKYCPSFYSMTSNRQSGVQVDILRLATNRHIFRPGKPTPKFKSDYVFAGSFWNKERDIQSLFSDIGNSTSSTADRDILSQYQGIIVGTGWDKANLNLKKGVKAHAPVPYRRLPLLYRSSKVAIDDANHVTKPWGSINSRVYDALASGTLILTNSHLDVSAFKTIALPVYTNTSDLQAQVVHFLTNEKLRSSLTKALRKETLTRHTYDIRANELVTKLKTYFGLSILMIQDGPDGKSGTKSEIMAPAAIVADSYISLPPGSMRRKKAFNKQPACDFSSAKKSICVGIRTMPSHKDWIGAMVSNLLTQYINYKRLMLEKVRGEGPNRTISNKEAYLDLQLYIVDTDMGDADYLHFLNELVLRTNENLLIESHDEENCHVQLLYDPYTSRHRTSNSLYGYDWTDIMLKEMLSDAHCEWIMFTNGDNLYNKAWFSTVVPTALNPTIQLIGWDFVTHHKREGQSNSLISIKLERKFLDLGSVLIRADSFFPDKKKHGKTVMHPDSRVFHKFLPQAYATIDLFVRDFFLIKEINSTLTPNQIKLYHECLLFHQ